MEMSGTHFPGFPELGRTVTEATFVVIISYTRAFNNVDTKSFVDSQDSALLKLHQYITEWFPVRVTGHQPLRTNGCGATSTTLKGRLFWG
jgi:hypothetical protein